MDSKENTLQYLSLFFNWVYWWNDENNDNKKLICMEIINSEEFNKLWSSLLKKSIIEGVFGKDILNSLKRTI
jgi:hypothetical protein